MKKFSLILLVLLCATTSVFAQKGISFQGIARDADGNAVTNTEVEVEFSIGDDFSETQTLTTDDFGVFSATIGSVETTSFEGIDFSDSDNEKLKVVVDGVTIYDEDFNCAPLAKRAETAESADNGVPVGTIVPYAGAISSGSSLVEPVSGWLVCNGASLQTTGDDSKYDNLKSVLNGAWGTDLLPDLRGVFLRGANLGKTGDYADPENRSVGNFQKDEFKSHNHGGETSTDGNHRHQCIANATGAEKLTSEISVALHADHDNGDEHEEYRLWGINNEEPTMGRTNVGGNHSHTINSEGGSETRPINAAVNFLIKY